MFVDFRSLPQSELIEADLCIVGGGVAGITIALEFLETDISVCLVESGGFEPELETQALYAGESVGLPHTDLDACRMRYLGGSSNCWNGWCVPFDRHDFEPRPWVPYSGWPIGFDELKSYYVRAQPVCNLGPMVYDDEMWTRLGLNGPAFEPERLRASFWQYSTPLRFGEMYREQLARSKNVRVLLNANLVDIATDDSASEVRSVTVRDLSGKSSQINAKHYILATGGIENARALLLSRAVESNGIGNRHDTVGRYFMEHPYSICGIAMSGPTALDPAIDKKFGSVEIGVGLRTGAGIQQRGEVVGAMAILDADQKVDHLFARSGALPVPTSGQSRYAFIAQSEQVPDPLSRVTLSDARDALGLNVPRLDWKMSEIDKRSITVLVEQIGAELARLGLGRARLADWLMEDGAYWGVVAGNHHMGTTRMGDDPRRSVVDRDCRVHGYRNLHIAGSSVFTTSSFANPTLTIVALALRLSDNMKKRLARPI